MLHRHITFVYRAGTVWFLVVFVILLLIDLYNNIIEQKTNKSKSEPALYFPSFGTVINTTRSNLLKLQLILAKLNTKRACQVCNRAKIFDFY